MVAGEVADLQVDPTQLGLFTRPDYYELLARLRREDPVHAAPGGVWVLSRWDDVRAVSRDPERFISRRGVLMNDPMRAAGTEADPTYSILHLDPPVHSTYRNLVNRRFSPRGVAGLEPAVRAQVAAVLDPLPAHQEIDAVERIAAPIPIAVITELLGIHEVDAGAFRRWSDAAIAAPDGATDQQLVDLGELSEFLLAHVDSPAGDHNDVLSSLKGASLDGQRPLSRAEIMSFCLTLLVAGNETTRTLVSGALEVLAAHPEQRALLTTDPGRIPHAVEEILRWVTPIQAFARTAARDVEIRGVPIPAGVYVAMIYASANRDEAAFGPTAGRFDVRRPVDVGHVAFGFGEHLCLGAALARLEARIVLEELLARFPHYAVVGPPTFVASTMTRGIATLPVVLDPS